MARRAVPTARFLENRRVMFDNGIAYVTQLRFSRNYLQLNLYNGVYFISRLCSVYVLPPMQQLRCGFCFLCILVSGFVPEHLLLLCLLAIGHLMDWSVYCLFRRLFLLNCCEYYYHLWIQQCPQFPAVLPELWLWYPYYVCDLVHFQNIFLVS